MKATRGRRGPQGRKAPLSAPVRMVLGPVLPTALALVTAACGTAGPAGTRANHPPTSSHPGRPPKDSAQVIPTTAAPAARTTVAGPPVLRAARVPGHGTVLVDRKGYTLYYQPGSTAGGVGTFVCTGTCTRTFRPLLLPPGLLRPTAGRGVPRPLTTVGVVVRPGGALQVAYEGRPLYTYAGDRAPGQANGLKVSGWRIVRLG